MKVNFDRLQAADRRAILVASDATYERLTEYIDRAWIDRLRQLPGVGALASKIPRRSIAIPHLSPEEAARRFRFDVGGAVDGHAYVMNPYQVDHYWRPAEARERLAREKLAAFSRIAAALGAKEVTLLSGEARERRASGALGGPLPPQFAAQLGLKATAGRSSKTDRQVRWSFDPPDVEPYLPDDLLAWTTQDPLLRAFVQNRLEAHPTRMKVDLTVGEELNLGLDLAAKLSDVGVEVGGTGRTVNGSQWTFDVEFWPRTSLVPVDRPEARAGFPSTVERQDPDGTGGRTADVLSEPPRSSAMSALDPPTNVKMIASLPASSGSAPGPDGPAERERLRRTRTMLVQVSPQVDRWTVGRDSEHSFTLDDPSVSRTHARVTRESGRYVIEDCDSANGTFVRGRRMSRGERLPIQPGEEVKLGAVPWRFSPTSTISSSTPRTQRCVQALRATAAAVGTHFAGRLTAEPLPMDLHETATAFGVDLVAVGRTVAAPLRLVERFDAPELSFLRAAVEHGRLSVERLAGFALVVEAAQDAAIVGRLGDAAELATAASERESAIVTSLLHPPGTPEGLVAFASRQFTTEASLDRALLGAASAEVAALARRAWEELQVGEEDAAFETASQLLRDDNTVFIAHVIVGLGCETRGQHAAAEDHLRRARRLAGTVGIAFIEYAVLQLAAVLDRRGRAVEALSAMRDGLGVSPNPAYSFYLAELEAWSGEVDAALAAFRAALAGDTSLRTAAMLSERLQALQPGLSRALIEHDESLRRPIFELLYRTAAAVSQIRALGAPADEVCRSAATVFEQVCTAHGSALHGLRARAEEVAGAGDREFASAVEAVARPLVASIATLERHIAGTPPIAPPEPTVEAKFSAAARIVLGAVVAVALAPVVVSLLIRRPDLLGESLWFACTVLGLAAGLALIGVALSVRRRRARLAQRIAADSAAWMEWSARAAALTTMCAEHRRDLVRLLADAPTGGQQAPVSDRLVSLCETPIPMAPSPPAWVEIPSVAPIHSRATVSLGT